MNAPATPGPEQLTAQAVEEMSGRIDGLLEQRDSWRITPDGIRTGILMATLEDGSTTNSTVAVIDGSDKPREYRVLTETTRPGRSGGNLPTRQHLAWKAGDVDAYRIDGGYQMDPAMAGRQEAIDRRNKEADAKVAAANEAERLRTDIPEDDKLYIMGANHLSSIPLRGRDDIHTALAGIQQGELAPLPKRRLQKVLSVLGIKKG